jgi:hypothetical protein
VCWSLQRGPNTGGLDQSPFTFGLESLPLYEQVDYYQGDPDTEYILYSSAWVHIFIFIFFFQIASFSLVHGPKYTLTVAS